MATKHDNNDDLHNPFDDDDVPVMPPKTEDPFNDPRRRNDEAEFEDHDDVGTGNV